MEGRDKEQRERLTEGGYRQVVRLELSPTYEMGRRLIGPENHCKHETWMKIGNTTLLICTLIKGQLDFYTYKGSYLINWKPDTKDLYSNL